MKVQYVIPFRDRGKDPYRVQNLKAVQGYLPDAYVSSDRRSGQFNRSAAYNNGVRCNPADIYVFYEADLIVPKHQLEQGIRMALEQPGLVVPFSKFLAITEEDSVKVRAGEISASEAQAAQQRGDRKSIGAVNICSKKTLDSIGQWDENFQGAWYDDDSMERAFSICCGPTRFVDGPAYHLYHLPGASGNHLSTEDIAATARNKARWKRYRKARTPEEIRRLTCESV